MKIAVCLATFNRKSVTLACIESVMLAAKDKWDVSWIVVDASSTDGTSEAILSLDLKCKIVKVGPECYWSRSMSLAMSLVSDEIDFVLLLNDDVQLSPDACLRFSRELQNHPLAILVGQTIDPQSGALSYGGLLRLGRHPLRLKRVLAQTEPIEVDTFNANIALLPQAVIRKIGGIDAEFEHAYGDLDYGFRAKRNGIQLLVMPGYLGTCTINPLPMEERTSRIEKLHYILATNRLPWRSQLRFTKRYGGLSWPVYFLAPYLKLLIANRLPQRIQ